MPYIPIVTADAVRFDNPREDDLIADDSPCSASACRLRKLSVEPILLAGTHQ